MSFSSFFKENLGRGSSTRRSLCEASEFRSISPLFDDRSLNITRNEPESIFDEHENQMVRSFKKSVVFKA